MLSRTNLLKEARRLEDCWSPKVVGVVNDQFVKVAKLAGEFAWHKHEEGDELFLILEGCLTMEYEATSIELHEGDIHIVPKGTMHNPHCSNECLVALVESKSTKHTGDLETEQTVSIDKQLEDFEG